MQIVLRNRRAVPSRLYDFIPIDPCCWRESGFWRRPAPFEQNEIPLKNSVESRDCAHPKITGAKLASVSTWSQLRLSRPSRIRPIFHHHVRLSKFHAALLASPPEQPRPPAFHPG